LFVEFCNKKGGQPFEGRLPALKMLIRSSEDQLLILQDRRSQSKAATNTEGNDKRNNKIKDDVALIGLACFAVVLRVAALAFDMGKHVGAKRASPPGVADFLCVALSALGTGCILNLFRHKVPPENEMIGIILQENFILPYHTNVGASPMT